MRSHVSHLKKHIHTHTSEAKTFFEGFYCAVTGSSHSASFMSCLLYIKTLKGSKVLFLLMCIMFSTPCDDVNCFDAPNSTFFVWHKFQNDAILIPLPNSHTHKQLGRGVVQALICSWSCQQTILCRV